MRCHARKGTKRYFVVAVYPVSEPVGVGSWVVGQQPEWAGARGDVTRTAECLVAGRGCAGAGGAAARAWLAAALPCGQPASG